MKTKPQSEVARPVVSDCRSRFKKAAAAEASRAKRSIGSEKKPTFKFGIAGVSDFDRHMAHLIDPTIYLIRMGFTVKCPRSGSLSVRMGRNERFRIHQQEHGDWIHCDKEGKVGGDNITLVRTIEPGIPYQEAFYRLIGGPSRFIPPTGRHTSIEVMRVAPKLSNRNSGTQFYGRNYFQGRGIDLDTIQNAGQQGFLAYNVGGVLFCGYDSSGSVRAITRRATTAEQARQKRDCAGKNKQYPAILKGEREGVVIVEGGVDALAVHTYARRCGIQKPTRIVTGGSAMFNFLKPKHVRVILVDDEKFTNFSENEENAEVRARTDGHRN